MGRQEQTLRDRGIRLTWRRQAILDIFRAAESHLSAEDVLHELGSRKIRANVTTVYRNLELLCGKGCSAMSTSTTGVAAMSWARDPVTTIFIVPAAARWSSLGSANSPNWKRCWPSVRTFWSSVTNWNCSAFVPIAGRDALPSTCIRSEGKREQIANKLHL